MKTENNFVIEFDYNLEALQQVKAEMVQVNKENIEELDTAVKKLVKIRRAIQTKGKTYRDDANAFNKRVLDTEKEYIGIIEPLEIEYKDLIEKEQLKRVIEARKELLPNKKRQLSVLKIVQPTDEEIIAMDDTQWVAFYDAKVSEHEQTLAIEVIKEQETKEAKEREERMIKEMEAKAKREHEEALARAEKEKIRAVEEAKQEAELKALRVKEEVERKIRLEKEAKEREEKQKADEQKKMEADKKYQAFLKKISYNTDTDILKNEGGVVKVYRLVDTFKI